MAEGDLLLEGGNMSWWNIMQSMTDGCKEIADRLYGKEEPPVDPRVGRAKRAGFPGTDEEYDKYQQEIDDDFWHET